MPRKLKVYRTPIGFHDAYVAAPSQKAALEAWGTDRNLFARGAAEEVTDAALTRAPLAHPGEVIRVARGTDAEHLAAAGRSPRDAKRRTPRTVSTEQSVDTRAAGKERLARPPKPKKTKPRPTRDRLAAAEKALEVASADRAAGVDAFRARAEEIARERRQFEQRQDRLIKKLERTRDRETASYERRLETWRREDGS